MNKLFSILLGGSLLILTACGGGWSTDQKTAVKNKCITNGGYDCDCYVGKAVNTFKSTKEYNKKESKLNDKFETAIKDCEVQVKEEKEENLESF